jgi:hypothetical protein
MHNITEHEYELPALDSLGTPRGGVVAPSAALTETPIAWAGRSLSAPPLDVRSTNAIGIPEAPSAGVFEGAEPPSAGGAEGAAPKLDTLGIVLPANPSRTRVFHSVRMSLSAWRAAVGNELIQLAITETPKGKVRRSWTQKARDLASCGKRIEALACGGCGDVMRKSGTIIASCGLRICCMCARRRANVLRTRLRNAWQAGERPREMSLYLLTFTLRFDPCDPNDLTIEALRTRKATALAAWQFVWRRYLKARSRAAVRAVEVSPSGLVHLHVLYHGHRPDAVTLRTAWMIKAGDSPQVNVRYVRNPAKGILEIAKYVTKGASPARADILSGKFGEFTDPKLAARVEFAFSGDRLIECYGAWRGIDPDDESEEPDAYGGEACSKCGCVGDWNPFMCSLDKWRAIAGPDWKPRIGRYGPRAHVDFGTRFSPKENVTQTKGTQS